MQFSLSCGGKTEFFFRVGLQDKSPNGQMSVFAAYASMRVVSVES